MRWAALLLLGGVLAGCTSVSDLGFDPPPKSMAATAGSYSVAMLNPRFGDRDPHKWTKRTPFGYAVHGVDVSKYQRNVDWATAKAGGVSFAFVKATEGGDRIDTLFRDHWDGTKAAGVPRAAYHFYYFCRPAEEQARWFIANVPKEKDALPPILDMEWNPSSPTCKLRPDKATVRAEMLTFLRLVENHYGKRPIIYTSVDFFDDNELSTFGGYPYWLRSVADHPQDRYGSHPFSFWQYTGTGIVPGIKGDADINVFNGSHAEWRSWLARTVR